MYLEDLPVGKRWESAGSITITEPEIIEFAERYDPQPMHTDPKAAAKGRFAGLIASGWHTAALAMKMQAEAKLFGDTELLGLGVDGIQWPEPVRPGDVLTLESEVIGNTPSRSKPDYGIVKVRTMLRNQHGRPVLVITPNCWVPRRPADTP
jgi:acyl dehydratase